jgi:hypothetical protein
VKVLVLAVCCKDDIGEYEMLSSSIKKTWGSVVTKGVEIFYLWCNNYKKKDKNDWVLNKPEGYGMLLWKTLGFLFEHRHDEFDYVVRVNVGSYIHAGRLVKYLEDKPREKFYCGQVGNYVEIFFVSGSCFILSRDLVMLSLRNIKQFGFDHIDDVSFGRFMMLHGIEPTFCPTKLRYLDDPDADDDERAYHWKLRGPDGGRQIDCEKMKQLYNEHYGNIRS